MGVWIETLPDEDYTDAMASLLMWECGLKHKFGKLDKGKDNVTPYVGVWIET